MGTEDDITAQQYEVWRRNRDDVEVFVEDAFESWHGYGRLVAWREVNTDRSNICTESYFVRAYTLVERPA